MSYSLLFACLGLSKHERCLCSKTVKKMNKRSVTFAFISLIWCIRPSANDFGSNLIVWPNYASGRSTGVEHSLPFEIQVFFAVPLPLSWYSLSCFFACICGGRIKLFFTLLSWQCSACFIHKNLRMAPFLDRAKFFKNVVPHQYFCLQLNEKKTQSSRAY